MRKHLAFITLIAFCGISPPASAIESVTNWQRSDAMAAVSKVDIESAIFEISHTLLSDDSESTLGQLRNLETRGDWPLPAREAAIFQFTRSLANLPRAAIPTDVMHYLLNYQVRTLVPHQDHESAYVPLFNIRGAAMGVENSWQRTDFELEAENLLATNPEALISGFVRSTSRNQRSAYLDALNQTEPATAKAVQDIAISRIDEAPALTLLVATTVSKTLDTRATQQLLVHGRGEGLSSALEKLKILPLSELSSLLEFAINKAPAKNASLAMAAWWPQLKHESDMRDLLIETLGDTALGSSAALVLAQGPDIQTLKSLQLVAEGDSIAAHRAQLALDISRDGLVGENRQ
jgi:hypothetical protein